jgi:hypothetical protein
MAQQLQMGWTTKKPVSSSTTRAGKLQKNQNIISAYKLNKGVKLYRHWMLAV